MNPKLVKVCGLGPKTDLKALAQLNISYFGFIFYGKSPRYVSESIDLSQIKQKKVGVFVNAEIDEILEKVAQFGLDIIQLHGTESPELCLQLKTKGLKIWKAVGINNEWPSEIFEAYQPYVHAFLLDYKSKAHGGAGKKFNWQLLEKYSGDLPLILAGGIGPQDAQEIKTLCRQFPFVQGVDLNSKFEIEPGLKNVNELAVFLNQLFQE